jgi:agmatine deiminase
MGSGSVVGRVVAAADWAAPAAIHVGWPTRGDVWREYGTPARKAIAAFVRTIVEHTSDAVEVRVLSTADNGALEAAREEFKADKPRVAVMHVEMNDCWLRDSGPIFGFSMGGEGEPTAVSFDFNAWGGKDGGCYSDYSRDRRVGGALAEICEVALMRCNAVLEGGSVSSDGRGTVVTTAECLIDSGNRNVGADRAWAESVLGEYLGARKVLWLPFGAARDSDTDGHVDNMCIFVGLGHLLLLWADAADDAEQHARSSAAEESLQGATDADGRLLTVHRVTAPRTGVVRSVEEAGVMTDGAKARIAGERVSASYINLLFAGEAAVFVPAFGVCAEDDERALREVQDAIDAVDTESDRGTSGRGRAVVSVQSREIVLAGGGIHCLTVSHPAKCATLF